jgi:ATP-dependent HslUV protease subunit HslV
MSEGHSIRTAPPSWRCAATDAVAIGGDGQVTLGSTVIKGNARKVRRSASGKVAGRLRRRHGRRLHAVRALRRQARAALRHTSLRAAIELAKDWRTDRYLRRLEAHAGRSADRERSLIVTGNGDVIEPEHGTDRHRLRRRRTRRLPRGRCCESDRSGRRDDRRARHSRIAADICIYTNQHTVERWIEEHRHDPDDARSEIVHELDKHIVGQDRRQARGGHRAAQPLAAPCRSAEPLRARDHAEEHPDDRPDRRAARPRSRAAWRRLANAPFIKVEATKFTEVGYVGRDVDTIIARPGRGRHQA